MCRNIKPLFNFEPPATDDEIRAAALQFVRKVSGFHHPSQANAAASVKAGAANAGDVMMAKIAGVKVLKGPSDGAGVLMSLTKTDEVLYLGEEKNGFAKVTSPNGDGWVKVVLLRKP